MNLDDLVAALDAYFRVPDVREDFSFLGLYPEPYWRDYVERGYEERNNGLMVRGHHEVGRAVTCVFPTDAIVDGLPPRTLLFSEHPVDLEDEPGFLPIARASFERMKERGISFYHVHGPLDQHPEVSPSRLIARGLGLTALEEYYPIVAGIPGGAAVIGASGQSLDDLAATLGELLGPEVPVRVLTRPRLHAGRVAVAAGGGAIADVLEASLDRGCETYVTGNAATRCRLESVQAELRSFRALAERAGVAVVDATHYGTEKPPQLAMLDWFRRHGLPAEFRSGGAKG